MCFLGPRELSGAKTQWATASQRNFPSENLASEIFWPSPFIFLTIWGHRGRSVSNKSPWTQTAGRPTVCLRSEKNLPSHLENSASVCSLPMLLTVLPLAVLQRCLRTNLTEIPLRHWCSVNPKSMQLYSLFLPHCPYAIRNRSSGADHFLKPNQNKTIRQMNRANMPGKKWRGEFFIEGKHHYSKDPKEFR